ncbi:MAG: hypothetical protein WD052_05655 [Bacteroidales bacterium]
MKDTVITSIQKRRELYILAVCTLAAVVLNIVGIIKFGTQAIELLTQIPVVLLVTVILYLALGVLRIVYYYISKLFKK